MDSERQIRTEVLPIGDLHTLNHSGLMIPSIQRDYKWGPGHQDQDDLNSAAYVFLEDMLDFFSLRDEDDIYFTGTMIVFEEPGEPRTQLMDGQQRWTTITALTSIIRFIILKSNDKAKYQDIVEDIEERFLLLQDGQNFLASRKMSDKKSLNYVVNMTDQSNIKDLPASFTNVFSFKRDDIKYDATALNATIAYFYNKLMSHFQISGPFSELEQIVSFYKCLRDYVYINYSHTKSPTLAYKMFVTANSRGTPLNNFDVFRGLVLANNRIKGYGSEDELQEYLDDTDKLLQDLFSAKKDFAKAIDQAMSNALTILMGTKVSTHHVLSRLEHLINSYSSRDELYELVGYFYNYAYELEQIEKGKGIPGKVEHLRLSYIGFKQHLHYYVAARLFWDSKDQYVSKLMKVLEIVIFRRHVLQGKNISKLFYGIAPKHYKFIQNAYTDEEKQACIDKISGDFEKWQLEHGPNDTQIKETLLVNPFNVDKASHRRKLVATFCAIDDSSSYSNWLFESSNGNPKIVQFMPKYSYNADRAFNYPSNYDKKQTVHGIIGNMFLVTAQITLKLISEIDGTMNSRSRFIHNNGKKFSTFQKIMYEPWSEKAIKERTNQIVEKLIKRFPDNCKISD